MKKKKFFIWKNLFCCFLFFYFSIHQDTFFFVCFINNLANFPSKNFYFRFVVPAIFSFPRFLDFSICFHLSKMVIFGYRHFCLLAMNENIPFVSHTYAMCVCVGGKIMSPNNSYTKKNFDIQEWLVAVVVVFQCSKFVTSEKKKKNHLQQSSSSSTTVEEKYGQDKLACMKM